jgi:hypothetical protein
MDTDRLIDEVTNVFIDVLANRAPALDSIVDKWAAVFGQRHRDDLEKFAAEVFQTLCDATGERLGVRLGEMGVDDLEVAEGDVESGEKCPSCDEKALRMGLTPHGAAVMVCGECGYCESTRT